MGKMEERASADICFNLSHFSHLSPFHTLKTLQECETALASEFCAMGVLVDWAVENLSLFWICQHSNRRLETGRTVYVNDISHYWKGCKVSSWYYVIHDFWCQ